MEQSREPTNRNRIGGEVVQGERAKSRKALVTKRGGVDPAIVQGRNGLLSGETLPYARKGDALKRSEKSAEAVVVSGIRQEPGCPR